MTLLASTSAPTTLIAHLLSLLAQYSLLNLTGHNTDGDGETFKVDSEIRYVSGSLPLEQPS